MKSLAKVVVLLALAAVSALSAVTIADARPNRGVWKGSETAEFTNGRYVNFSAAQKRSLPIKFRVRGRARRISNFKATKFEYTCINSAGEAVASYDVTPEFRKLRKHRRGRFSAKDRDTFDGRTFRTYVKGQFLAPRRAKGKLKVKVSGCRNVVATKWRAKGPRRPRRRPSGGGGGGGSLGGNPCGTPVYEPGYTDYNGDFHPGHLNYCPGLY